MSVFYPVLVVLAAAIVVAGGLLTAPYAFADRLAARAALGPNNVGGLSIEVLPTFLVEYEKQLQQQTVEFLLRGNSERLTLGELGVALNIPATTQILADATQAISPVVTIDRAELNQVVEARWSDDITPPQNASLAFNAAGILAPVPSATGEGIDVVTLEQDILSRAKRGQWHQPIELGIISEPPLVTEEEVEPARLFAEQLLREGFTLTLVDQTWDMRPSTVRRLLRFTPQIDPNEHGNYILGVSFDSAELESYLAITIAPEINQPAINARFTREGDRVTQFALPQEGRAIDTEATHEAIAAAVAKRGRVAGITAEITQPAVADTSDIESLGVATLLATGVSDFKGSPANRTHNIEVGTSRYHGLLIPQGASFSFNEFLGPVDAAHNFKPELVIKSNVTIPEYGGGLCQVSSTIFRAALNAGLEITERRNHAYAVSYYGTPGLDATIYPPYTDLRFTNNTPGYILIQTRIEGTQLSFDFWGTDDGREVLVGDPNVYGRQANGAVRASVEQTVVRDGEVIVEDTFYSRYKSPDLFPKVVAANNPT